MAIDIAVAFLHAHLLMGTNDGSTVTCCAGHVLSAAAALCDRSSLCHRSPRQLRALLALGSLLAVLVPTACMLLCTCLLREGVAVALMTLGVGAHGQAAGMA